MTSREMLFIVYNIVVLQKKNLDEVEKRIEEIQKQLDDAKSSKHHVTSLSFMSKRR